MKKKLLFSVILLAMVTLLPKTSAAQPDSAVSPSGHTLYYSTNVNGYKATVVSPYYGECSPGLGYYVSVSWWPDFVEQSRIDYSEDGTPIYYYYFSDYSSSMRDSAWSWPYEKPTGNVTVPGNASFYWPWPYNSYVSHTVTGIGDLAFVNCSDMTSISLPSSITYIGISAFEGCTGLTSCPTIGNSVTEIGENAFAGCSGMTGALNIPNLVGVIKAGAFYNCSGLTSLTLGQSIYTIGPLAFQGCSGLTGPLNIPNSVQVIECQAFSGCSGLTSLTIGDSIWGIGANAFRKCTGLTGSLVIPNSVTTMLRCAFYRCSGLTSLTLSESLNGIAPWSFGYCTGLTSVVIPDSVHYIYNDAFDSCVNMTSLTIGNHCYGIYYKAFANCRRLSSITFTSGTPPYMADSVFYNVPSSCTIYCPCGSLAAYRDSLPQFYNFIEYGDELAYEFSAVSEDTDKGTVQIVTEPTCSNPTAVVRATPATGYQFDHWSNGSTANPLSYTVTEDVSLIAFFSPIGSQPANGIDDVAADNIKIYINGRNIVIEGSLDESVTVYDVMGRTIYHDVVRAPITVPATGVYMVKIGNAKARKVVILR